MPYTKKPVASRILSKYEQERAYRLHRQKVSSVRHGIDNSPPKRYPHLLLRLKQIQKEEEKMAEVDHENKLLLQKMTQIMRTHGRIDNWNLEHEPRSLNYPYKHKQLEKIAEENISIARRLETVQPIYNKEEWEEEYQQRRYLMDLWAYSTKDYDDTPRGKYKRSKGEDSDGKYDSDFESDDDAKSSKLPSIDESDKKSDTKKEPQKKSKDDSHTKLPKINEKKKESLGIDHNYEMYWGDRYDPDGNKENSKGKSDQDDNEAVQEGKKSEKGKDNAKGKKDREDDKKKDDKNKDDNKKRDGKKDDKSDAKKKDGTKEEKKDDKKGTDKKGNETKEQGNNNAGKGSKDEEHSKSKTKADMTPVEADCKQLFKVAKEMAAPEDILIKTLVKKSPSYRQQVQRKFQEMYDLDLSKELKQGLGSDWNLLIDELLADPTEGDAGALHTALEKKNIPTVVEILCSNQGSLAQVKEAYRKEFAVSLEKDVANKTKEPVQLLLMTLLKEGREESTDVDDKRVEKDTTVLHEFGDGRWSNKSGKFLTLLEEKSLAHIKAVLKMYKSVSGGTDVLHSVKEECDQEYADAVGAFVSTVRSSSDTYAEKLYKNINATNPVFVKTLVTRAEIDMPSVRKAYKKKYDAELTEDIEDRCSHPTVKLLKELASKTPAKKSKGNKKYAGMALAPPPKGKPLKRPENKSKDDDSSQNPLNSKRGGEGSKQKKDDKKDEKAPKTTGTITAAKNFDALKEVEKLHKAMDGFGTDEQVIIDVISNKSNEQRQLLKKKYKEKYKKDLMKDLESELRGDFEELVLALMMEPTEYDAHCIHEAVKGPGTCEGTLIGILCTRSGKDIKAIKEHYRRAYTSDLENDIRSDTSGEFEELLVQLLKGGRDSGWEVNQKEAEDDAKALNKDKSIKVSDETFKHVMTKKNRLQAKATFAEYKNLSDQEIFAAIAASGDAKDGYEGLAKALEDPIKFYAARLHEGFKGLGTNDTQLIRILVSRSEIDLADIKAKYAELYGKTLKEKVEAECSGHYKRTLLTILGENNDSSKDDKAKAKTEKKKADDKSDKSEKKSVYLNNGPNTKENAKNTKGNKIKPKSDKSMDEKKKSGSKTPMLAERRSPDGQSDEINDKKNKDKDGEKEDNAWETMEPTGTIKAATDFKLEEQCKILYNAMDGIGTDEEAIITVLTSCNNSQRQQLKKTYKKTYKKELMAHLKSELTGDLEETVVLLLMEPTEFAVEGMHRAMDGVGTDERLLTYSSLVHSATPQDLKGLCKKYKEAHKKDLSKAVASETSGLIQKVLLNILAGKRSQTTQVKEKDVEESAKKLYGDGENAFKYDVEYCADLLTTLSPSEAKAVFSRYKELSGEDVTKSIDKHMAGYPEMACLSVARYLQSPYLYTAHVLHEATSGTGTNDNLLMAVIVGRSEIDLVNIMMAYKATFKKSLEDVVQSECSGDYRKLLSAILKYQS